jgi:PAS domain S-box-containing protein
MTNWEIRNKWKELHSKPDLRNTLRPEVRDSWERCYDYNLDPQLRENPYICTSAELVQAQDNAGYLMEASDLVMSSLYEFVAGTGFVVVLSDANLCMLKVVGDAESLAWSDNAYLVEGSLWSEELVGTNAGCLAIALAKPISIFGYEHFCLFSHVAACSCAPITDQGKIIGGLGMVAPFSKVNSHTLGMVVAASKHIKYKMAMEKARRYHEVIMDSMDEGLFTLDLNGTITYMNENCARIFKLQKQNVIGHNIYEFFGNNKENHYFINKVTQGQTTTDENFTLTINRETVHCSVTCNPLKATDMPDGGSVVIVRESNRINRLVRNYIGGGAKVTFDDIVVKDPKFMQIIKTSKAAASSSSNVLLLGESGTGKDIIAQAMHNASPRKNNAFLAINCAALPRDLIASELFGYEDGAFTGARKGGNVGKFELADQGTIFLDEIGDMPLDLQASLLRVLEEKKIMRLGGGKLVPVNVRVIAATNRDLESEIERNRFRRDLFYRLGVIKITIPPLRERPEDILPLTENFIEKTCKRFNKPLMTLAPDVLEAFMSYAWPGNVREMQNVIESSTQLASDNVITYDLVNEYFAPKLNSNTNQIFNMKTPTVAVVEKQLILDCLAKYKYNKTEVAKALGMSRRTLYRRLAEYEILE